MTDRPRMALLAKQTITLDDSCLHCAVMKVVEAAYPDGVVDIEVVLNNLADVIAEAIASHPERAERRRMTKMFTDFIEKRVPHKRAVGDYIGATAPKVH